MYYSRLMNEELFYPNPCYNQIELDLNRTFSDLKEEE